MIGVGITTGARGLCQSVDVVRMTEIVDYATWEGWYKLDEAERALGAADANFPRERKKIVEWEDMLGHSRAGQ